MPPRSSATAFDLGYRSGNHRRFLDQVDSKLSLHLSVASANRSSIFRYLTSLKQVGISLGGLVQFDRQALAIERDQQHHILNRLRLDRDAVELDLEDYTSAEEKLRNIKDELQSSLSEQAKLVEDAYAKRDLNTAMGLELAHKNLRVELSVRFRDLLQKAMELLKSIKTTHKKLSMIEFDIIRTEHRLGVINSQLRPINNLNDALNN